MHLSLSAAVPLPGSGETVWSVRTHRGAGAVERVTPTWLDLLRRIPEASAFATPGWARAWWRTYGRHHEAVIVEVQAGGRTVALMPLQVSHVRGLGTRVLEALGGSPADWRIWMRNPRGLGFKYVNELLVEPGHEDTALAALRDWLQRREVRWDMLRLACIPESSPLAQRFDAVAAGWSPQSSGFARVRVDTAQSFEEFRASLSKRQRQDVRYKPNELTRAVGSELRLDIVRGDGLRDAVEEFIAMFERRWTARGKPGLLSGEADMYRHLAEDEPDMVVCRLLGGERALASQIGFDDGRRYTPYNYAFDPEFSEKSPAHVLTQMIIEQCCADSHGSVEQLTEAMGRHWSKQRTRTVTLEATWPGAAGRTRAAAVRGAGNVVYSVLHTKAGNRARAALARVAAAVRR